MSKTNAHLLNPGKVYLSQTNKNKNIFVNNFKCFIKTYEIMEIQFLCIKICKYLLITIKYML